MRKKSRRDSRVTTEDTAARAARFDIGTVIVREANALIELGDPLSALALVEVWGIMSRYRSTHGWDPMSETDAARVMRIVSASQIDLRVKLHALASCIDAVRFGSWPVPLRPQLAEAAIQACAVPLVCLLPHF